MKTSLSLLIITKNFGGLLGQVLGLVKGLADEVVIVYEELPIKLKRDFGMRRQFQYKTDDLGKKRAFGLKKCRGEWILVLDDDEIISEELKKEIIQIIDSLLHGSIADKTMKQLNN